MGRAIVGFGIALVLVFGVIGLAGGPVDAVGAASVLAQQSGPETVAPPPPGYGYGYGYGPGWYGHGFSPFGFFFGPLFFLLWFAIPAAIIWVVVKGRRGPGGGTPPWLAEWHRRMHAGDLANSPAPTHRSDTNPGGGGTA